MKTKITLGSEFHRLRTESCQTLDSIAKRCRIAESTVWKVERDHPVRWETVHLCLLIGLRIAAGTDRYQTLHALWLAARNREAENRPPDKGTKKLSKHAAAAVKEFRALVRDLDRRGISKVMAAVRRASLGGASHRGPKTPQPKPTPRGRRLP